MAKVSDYMGDCVVFHSGAFKKSIDVFEILLIQPAGKFAAGISQ